MIFSCKKSIRAKKIIFRAKKMIFSCKENVYPKKNDDLGEKVEKFVEYLSSIVTKKV
jgi:hypothetical protein